MNHPKPSLYVNYSINIKSAVLADLSGRKAKVERVWRIPLIE